MHPSDWKRGCPVRIHIFRERHEESHLRRTLWLKDTLSPNRPLPHTCVCVLLLARRQADRCKWPGSTLPPPICILSAAPSSCPLLSNTPALSRSSPAWLADSYVSGSSQVPLDEMQLEEFLYERRMPVWSPHFLLPSIKEAEDHPGYHNNAHTQTSSSAFLILVQSGQPFQPPSGFAADLYPSLALC